MEVKHYENLVAHIAYEFARKYKMCEVADIRQQLWLWFFEHPNKVKLWETFDGKQSTKLVARSLRNAAKDYCQREKARSTGYRIEDVYYYERELVEVLLPSVLRGDTSSPATSDNNYTSTRKVASEGGNWLAMMGDIGRAMSKLTAEQFNIINLRFGDGCDNSTMALELSISEDAARMRVNRAMNNLLNYLGGDRPHRERDYTQEEMSGEQARDRSSEADIRDNSEETE